jgi:hypothetical protein
MLINLSMVLKEVGVMYVMMTPEGLQGSLG